MTYFAFLRENVRWLVAGFLLTFFSGSGQTFFISLSAGSLREAFSLSHGELGLLYMLATLCSASVLPFVGKSMDVYPAQRVAAVVIAGLTLCCLAMASVSEVWMVGVVFFGLRLCGQGMMTHISMTATSRWFSAQRGRAISVAALGIPTAEAVMPILFVTLIGMIGWRWSWVLAAGVMALVAMPVILFLLAKERHPSRMEIAAARPEGRQWTRPEVLRDVWFWVVLVGLNGPPFIATAILFHQIYLVELRGWQIEFFASSFFLMACCAVAMALTTGMLVDRFTARRLLPLILLPLSAACFVLAWFHATTAVFVFMVLLGLSNGFVWTLIGALWPEIYGTRHNGAIRSVVTAVMVFASAAGPGLIGWLIDVGVAYDTQIAGMGVFCLIATLLLTLASRAIGMRDNSVPANP